MRPGRELSGIPGPRRADLRPVWAAPARERSTSRIRYSGTLAVGQATGGPQAAIEVRVSAQTAHSCCAFEQHFRPSRSAIHLREQRDQWGGDLAKALWLAAQVPSQGPIAAADRMELRPHGGPARAVVTASTARPVGHRSRELEGLEDHKSHSELNRRITIRWQRLRIARRPRTTS